MVNVYRNTFLCNAEQYIDIFLVKRYLKYPKILKHNNLAPFALKLKIALKISYI